MGNDLQLYKQLLSLPLFQGLSKGDLEEVVTHTRLGFETYNEGQYIVQENAPCHQLIFVLKGNFEVETIAANHNYSITEILHAPELLQPERLWGLMQFYTKSFRCKTSCQILSIEKSEIMKLCDQYLIFRINLFNLLSTAAQRSERRLLRLTSASLEHRIIYFFADRCLQLAGAKTIKIKMTQLATEINDSRLDVSRALNNLQQMGLIRLRRNYIEIEKLEKILQHLAI